MRTRKAVCGRLLRNSKRMGFTSVRREWKAKSRQRIERRLLATESTESTEGAMRELIISLCSLCALWLFIGLLMRRIIAQTRKELTQIVRDWRTLALALVLPLILLVLSGAAISLTATNLPIIAQDYDDSPASREFLDAFRASLTFHIVPFPVDKKPAEAFASNTA